MKKIIFVRLEGGLGNQLFQYFAAREISQRLNTIIYLDVTYFYHKYTKEHEKPYLLEYAYISNHHKVWRRAPRLTRELWKLLAILSKIRLITLVDERNFDRRKHSKILFLKGYFHDLRFMPRKQQILEVLDTMRINELEEVLKELDFGNCEGVFHVRRGDYLSQREVYEVLRKGYYTTALRLIKEMEAATKFKLMSDEPVAALDWLDLKISEISILDGQNQFNPCEIIEIVSRAKAIVIANSTFSWWAAYLGTLRCTTELVIYPIKFNNLNALDVRNSLGLEGWIALDGDGIHLVN